jgi:hypothetical protein
LPAQAFIVHPVERGSNGIRYTLIGMRSLFAQARTLGVDGPDLAPYKKGPMSQSYPFFHTCPPQRRDAGNLEPTGSWHLRRRRCGHGTQLALFTGGHVRPCLHGGIHHQQ